MLYIIFMAYLKKIILKLLIKLLNLERERETLILHLILCHMQHINFYVKLSKKQFFQHDSLTQYM